MRSGRLWDGKVTDQGKQRRMLKGGGGVARGVLLS